MTKIRDISIIKKVKQKNVQEQNSIEKDCIFQCASEFRRERNLPSALIECFQDKGINIETSILIWHDTMPFGGPTEAFRGGWLTQDKRFFEYEIYLDSESKYVTEIDVWEDITDKVEINERKAGTGKTSGWLSIEVLNELNT